MIKIVICDDDKKDSLNTKLCVQNLLDSKELRYNIEIVNDAKSVVDVCKNVDFLFLDMEIGENNGILVGSQLRNNKNNCHIIITSYYQKYLLDGYKIKPDRYLLKPYSQDQFNQIIDPVIDEYLEENRFLSEEKIRIKDIYYLEYERKHTFIYLKNHKIKTSYSLSYWIDTLKNESFSQCYKSILVNVKKIKFLDKQDVYLENDSKLPVSRYYKKQFEKDWVKEMVKTV